jgi:HlyD family secretion protein
VVHRELPFPAGTTAIARPRTQLNPPPGGAARELVQIRDADREPAAMKRIVLIVLILVVGGAAGVVGTQHVLQRRHAAANGALRIFGTIDLRDAQLAFNGQERIESVAVEEGDRVTKGQLLATLDHRRLDAERASAEARVAAQDAAVKRLEHGTRPQEIEQARAQVAAAQARVANDEIEVTRFVTTASTGASSARERDDATARLDVDRASLEVAKKALELAIAGPREEDLEQARAELAMRRADLLLLQKKLDDCELHAPSNGVVQTRILEPGEMASPDRPVLNVALTDPKWVRAYVSEGDLGRIRGGQRATIASDSFGGRAYEGRVGFISSVAEFTPKTVETEELRTQLVYEVRILVTDPADELRLGMPVTVDVDLSSAADAAPRAATPDGAGH